MTDKKIVELYKSRQYTILELSKLSGKPYEEVRQLIVKAGYHYGKLV